MAETPARNLLRAHASSLEDTSAVQALVRRIEAGESLSLVGIAAAAHPFVTALLHLLFPERTIVVVVGGVRAQETFHQDLQTWLGSTADDTSTALFFPPWDALPDEEKLPHADVISERLETLLRLNATGKPGGSIIVASAISLMQKTFPPAMLTAESRRLAEGDTVDPTELIEWLEAHSYEPEVQVNAKGEFAMRGGIVDVFPLPSLWPVRLEFFGDELESLRWFDPISQVSRGEVDSIILPPAGELGLLRRRALTDPDFRSASLLAHLPKGSIVIHSQPDDLASHADEYEQQVSTDSAHTTTWSETNTLANSLGMLVCELEDDPNEIESDWTIHSLDAYRPLGDKAPDLQVQEAQRKEFFSQLHRWMRQDYAVHVFCNNEGERQRFEEVWKELGFDDGTKKQRARLQVHVGAIARGFVDHGGRLAVVTDAEIFGRYRVARPRRMKSPHAQTTRSALDIDFSDLEEGDHVVHLQQGIGRYLGLIALEVRERDGSMSRRECLAIEFAPSEEGQEPPKLYVPVTEAHLVSKYVGAGKIAPKLNKLGSKRWNQAKRDAERAVEDLAAQFLSIQAKRDALPGHGFKGDTPWQREFEASFLYEETPDQAKAIEESKRDMERPKPMDRLICGDVGYGKTEVAIRTAFKTVMEGKQVAILVPTTVLSQQHFNTFRERMADYPVRIDLLSRFRTKGQQAKTVEGLATGAVDIVIGTHRLIQKDIRFKDLGLVVIDEEQRFGVMHKERFKQLRELVDVLTLSATPIPRTLYLALTGARDMSTIETPPQDRLPVETIVTQYDERLIRDAIQRELNREGQVFFLHNRVGTIDAMAAKLRELLPRARIIVGHGQMSSDELEEIMTAFVNGEADVLLSTTIIESGIDIPNANTIIIDRADRFGLSQLYQLRGRVGRYKNQAYAYLLLPRHARLLTDVRKRMSAIKQYSSLGSGFKIAMRDLEIRGAGNLLGPEQSGHITAVGFDLYCQLLKQSVSRMKGEPVKERVEVQIRIDFLELNPAGTGTEKESKRSKNEKEPTVIASACLPFSYVPEGRHRIELYRRLAQVDDRETLAQIEQEIRDRFGPHPDPVKLLFQITELKLLAAPRRVTSIEVREGKLMLTRNNDYLTIGGRFPRITKKNAKARLKEIRTFLQSI